MLYDLTYSSRQTTLDINKAIGRPYGLFHKKRWQGIGSERLIVAGAQGKLAEVFDHNYTQNFANVELRPNGIIVRIRYRLELYGLAIPFYHLSIFKSNPGEISLYDGANRITLKHYQGRQLNKGFIQKLLDAKAEHHPDRP